MKSKLETNLPQNTIIQRLEKLAIGKLTYSPAANTFKFRTRIEGTFGGRRGIDITYVTGTIHKKETGYAVEYTIFPGYIFRMYCIAAVILSVLELTIIAPKISFSENFYILVPIAFF